MDIKGLDYNTQREKLVLSEYGREIQKMVDVAIALPTKEERMRCAQTIIRQMEMKNPQVRQSDDWQQTLWNHLYARLGIPESVLSLAENKKGLVLITGSAGTGKSTTLACMIDRINKTRDCHIITMEDPIEYIHRHDKAIVTQREISIDTPGYLESLRSALRESPDVILLGEMRDYDTISAAITAAETGVLLLSTLHTSSAANTISRILDVFPAAQQKQVKIQLAQILKGVVCQQLVPSVDGAQIPVFEILKPTVAIQNMIREDKLHQLESAMQAGAAEGMCTMDGSLLKLCMEGRITRDTALLSCVNYETMAKRLRM